VTIDGAPARTLAKPQRQHRVARLLADNSVTSQSQLVELLAADRITATQATVSRDLEDLGAIKVRVPGGETVYAIPELPAEQRAPEDHLRRVFSEWVVEVGHSANLVVVRTPPGSAHVVGSALDRSGLAGVLGTVAGDDTVIVVVVEQVAGPTWRPGWPRWQGSEETRKLLACPNALCWPTAVVSTPRLPCAG
jgi:transcriptional regulator of arginine metabolism